MQLDRTFPWLVASSPPWSALSPALLTASSAPLAPPSAAQHRPSRRCPHTDAPGLMVGEMRLSRVVLRGVVMTSKQILHHRRLRVLNTPNSSGGSRLHRHAFQVEYGAMASGDQSPIKRSRSPPGGPADFGQKGVSPIRLDELAVFRHQ